ncbi:MAG: TPM domain-containing protein [Bacteroidetes bacterium]|nr:TPM domain-containing protein [Bacteroidota bacterium]
MLKPTHFDDFEGSPYLVMQYCHQGSVFGKIGEMSEQELARFMQQAGSALNYLHSQEPPIIHQDIKPDNFLIDANGNYLLADFGISSKIRRTLTKSMGAQASTGTLAYMPPEKFSADKQIIKAGDIFSLGVAMYELLTGDLPFGDNGGLTLKAGAEVPNLPGNFSPGLNSLLKKCLSKEPWDRPTAEQLEEVAGKFLQTGQWKEVGKDATKSEPKPSKEPEQPRGGRKTEAIPQRQTEPQSESKFETEPEPEPERKRNFIPWIIAAVVVIVGIILVIDWYKGTSAKEFSDHARRDSILVANSVALVEKNFPDPKGSVSDFENILTDNEIEELTTIIKNFEKETGNEIAIVTIDSISPDTDFMKYSIDLANYWGIGKKDKNIGLLILVSKKLKKIRISTGYDTEKKLNDETCQKIIDAKMVPKFKTGNYYQGIKDGLSDLIYNWRRQ